MFRNSLIYIICLNRRQIESRMKIVRQISYSMDSLSANLFSFFFLYAVDGARFFLRRRRFFLLTVYLKPNRMSNLIHFDENFLRNRKVKPLKSNQFFLSSIFLFLLILVIRLIKNFKSSSIYKYKRTREAVC